MQEPENRIDFRSGALPVCGRKREEGERMNAEARRGLDDAASGFRAGAVASGARQAAGRGLAAVAVGNDGDVQAGVQCWLGPGGDQVLDGERLHVSVLSPPPGKYHKLLCRTK